MEKSCSGTVLGLAPLPSGYFLLELGEVPIVAPGNNLQISGKTYGVMRSHPQRHSVALLGKGASPAWKTGERLAYQLDTSTFDIPAPQTNSRFLLVGEELGMAQIIFLAERLKQQRETEVTALLGFCTPPPFRPAPSKIMMPPLPAHVIAAVPLLEAWGIASRIANTNAMPGCYEGDLQHLVGHWLNDQEETTGIEVFICASQQTCRAIKELAGEQTLSCLVIGD